MGLKRLASVSVRLNGSGVLEEHPTLTAYISRGAARAAYQRAFDAQLAVYTRRPPSG